MLLFQDHSNRQQKQRNQHCGHHNHIQAFTLDRRLLITDGPTPPWTASALSSNGVAVGLVGTFTRQSAIGPISVIHTVPVTVNPLCADRASAIKTVYKIDTRSTLADNAIAFVDVDFTASAREACGTGACKRVDAIRARATIGAGGAETLIHNGFASGTHKALDAPALARERVAGGVVLAEAWVRALHTP